MHEVDLAGACQCLQDGQVLIYPTETFYGLGVDIRNGTALQNLVQLKGRDPSKPISVLIPDREALTQVAGTVTPAIEKLISRFLPGPLTLVLPAHPGLDPRIHGGTGSVGIRISAHPLTRALMLRYGRPITTTSANPSRENSGRFVDQLRDYFGKEDVCLLNGGDLSPSRGSTVIKITGENLQLLREGDIPFSALQKEFSE